MSELCFSGWKVERSEATPWWYPLEAWQWIPNPHAIADRYEAVLMIDEAHSAFVFGPTGKGVAEDQGVEDEVDIHLGTFSKSLGGQGGYICGSRDLMDYLRGFTRSRFFSCALAPTVVAGLVAHDDGVLAAALGHPANGCDRLVARGFRPDDLGQLHRHVDGGAHAGAAAQGTGGAAGVRWTEGSAAAAA